MNKQAGLLLTMLVVTVMQVQADASTPGIVIAKTLTDQQKKQLKYSLEYTEYFLTLPKIIKRK